MTRPQTLERVDRDLEAGDYGKGRDRLHGLIATYPDDLTLRRKLGEVYWKLYMPAMAGRYWYLEAEKTGPMTEACAAFERSCGRDALQMLLAIKFKGDLKALENTFAGDALNALHTRARKQYPEYDHFQRQGAKKFQREIAKENLSNRFVRFGCVALIFVAILLMVVGIFSILWWVF